MEGFSFHAPDEQATMRFGSALAQHMPEGAVIALCGTLGAGKTRLVQAIAEAAGVDRRDVVSPTFVLVHQYDGRRTIHHMDAYRIRDEDEFLQLGPDEYFDSPGWTLIEWADRVQPCLPDERIDIHIQVTGAESRRFELAARGDRYAGLARALQATLQHG